MPKAQLPSAFRTQNTVNDVNLNGLKCRKVHPNYPFMISENQAEQLNLVVDKLLSRERPPFNALSGVSAPFDVSRPNIHDSKKEFMREMSVVETITKHLSGVIDQIIVPNDQESLEHKELVERLKSAIEGGRIQDIKHRAISNPSDLALNNLHMTGFFYGSMRVVFDMYVAYNQRLIELKDQNKQFWNVASRPPNYYARTIAVRLARLYSREMGQRPTFGISREGNHPSTDFGRALEEVYSILKIRLQTH